MGEAAREIPLEDRGISEEKKPADVIDMKPKQEAKEEESTGVYEKVQFLSERINSFNEALKLLSESDAKIVGENLAGLEEQRNELSGELTDEQMKELGLGKERVLQLNEKMDSLRQRLDSLEGEDGDEIVQKHKELFDRTKELVDGFNESEKEEFSKQVSENGIVLLGLEEYRVKHINEALDILKNASKQAKDSDKKAIIDEKRKVLNEKRNIFAGNLSKDKRQELGIVGVEGMRDEKIREEYGIKTMEEFEEELKAA